MPRRNSGRSAVAASADGWYAASDLAEDEPAIWFHGRPAVVIREVKKLFDWESLILMANVLKKDPSPDFLCDLHEKVARAAAHYFFVRDFVRNPRISELREEIKELHESLERSLILVYGIRPSAWIYMLMSLMDVLRAVDKEQIRPEHGNALFIEWLSRATDENLSIIRNRDIEHLLQWAAAAEFAYIALAHDEDKGGRKKEFALPDYIDRLASVFKELFGRNAGLTQSASTGRYSGAYFEFLTINLRAVDPGRKLTNVGLGRAAQRALAEERRLRRRRPAPKKYAGSIA